MEQELSTKQPSDLSKQERDRFSYTALSTFENCPRSFMYKYILHERPEESTIATEIGSILHKGRELVSTALMQGQKPDYEGIKRIVYEGWTGHDKANGDRIEQLMGINDIKVNYWEDWMAEEEGIPSYNQRMQTYLDHLRDEEQNTEWHPIAAEKQFSYLYGGVELFGVIDKIEENDKGQLRIIDYKSSKKVYDEKKLKSPLQLYVYTLAVQQMYPDKEIEGCYYDFIMLGEIVQGGTKGWENRCQKKLQKLVDGVKLGKINKSWKPKPSPLCYWCSYSYNNPKSQDPYRYMCPYYSLWTPQVKTFEVAQKWDEETDKMLTGGNQNASQTNKGNETKANDFCFIF